MSLSAVRRRWKQGRDLLPWERRGHRFGLRFAVHVWSRDVNARAGRRIPRLWFI